MPLIKSGECNHCGKCCLPPVMVENPCIERGQDRCKFYAAIEGPDLYGHCLIYSSWAPIELARDRFGTRITQEQIGWFNQNCIDYPSTGDYEAGHTPPSDCGFTFEEQG